MDLQLKQKEEERAERICRRIEEYHIILSNTYDDLVDRDFRVVQKNVQFLIMELRCILKSIEEDDF
jgi:hypothetical protein